MRLFNSLRVDTYIDRCLQASSLEEDGFVSSIKKLKQMPGVAVQKLLDKVPGTTKSEVLRIRQVLWMLVDTSSLPSFFIGLQFNVHPEIMKSTTAVLVKSTRFDPSALLPLLDDNDSSKSAILTILEAHRKRINPVLLIQKTGALRPGERLKVFQLLEDVDNPDIVPELVSRITAKDPNTRLGIVRLLGKYDNSQAKTALLGRLTDSSKKIRFEALESLEKINTQVDIGVLCTLIKDEDYNIQNRAVDAIVRRNDPKTVKYLMALFKHEDEYVRRGAVEVLNGIEYPNAVEDLLVALKDEDWWVRARAADALAKIGGKKVIDAVVKLIKSDDEYVRRSAIEILNSTRDESAMDELIKALDDADWWVRERAIDALAGIGNKKANPALLELMARDNQAAPVVLRAMTKLGDDSVVPGILKIMKGDDPNIIVEAMHTLTALVSTVNRDEVVAAIQSRSKESSVEEVEYAAREALEEISRKAQHDMGILTNTGMSGTKENTASKEQNKQRLERPITVITRKDIDIKALKSGDSLSERYTFIRRIGKGAFSTVLLVEDTVISEQLILKVLHQKMASEESMIKRFIRELRYARKINHDYVIRIYDFIQIGSLYAISMEYFPSLSMSAELEGKKPLDFARSIKLIADVALGLEAAHKLGIIHRDIKPGNILVDNKDEIKIVDFGISAAQSGGDTKLTKTGILIGTPRYMAPEQVLGKKLSPRTDIYSLGIIFYEMLAGVTAFAGDDNMAVLYQHVHGDIKPVHEVNKEIPLPLSNIVMKMMEVKPEDRYESMIEVSEVLNAYEI